jgi:hypothetical protein
MGLSAFLGMGTPGFKARQERGAEPPIPAKSKQQPEGNMEHVIKGTSGTRGEIRFEDLGDTDAYKVTVTNGRFGDAEVIIRFTISKEELKRLGKAS